MSGIRAILLGTAQDAGVPQAGCTCKRCVLAQEQPALRAPVSCLGLVHEDTGQAWLIDATPDLPTQLYQLLHKIADSRLVGIVLTHAHIGHYSGLMYLGREGMNCRSLPVVATAAMARFLRQNAPWADLVQAKHVVLQVMTPGQPLALAPDLQIRPVTAPHRDEHSDTMALVIQGSRRSLFYCPDIDFWRQDVLQVLGRCDVALVDGTFFRANELPGRNLQEIPHPPVQSSVEQLAGLETDIWFVHLNHSNPLWGNGEERRWLQERGFDVAEVGQMWRLA